MLTVGFLILRLCNISHNCLWHTKSKALLLSMKARYTVWWHSLLFSATTLILKIWSLVPTPDLKPICTSLISLFAALCMLCSKIRSSTLLLWLISDIALNYYQGTRGLLKGCFTMHVNQWGTTHSTLLVKLKGYITKRQTYHTCWTLIGRNSAIFESSRIEEQVVEYPGSQ